MTTDDSRSSLTRRWFWLGLLAGFACAVLALPLYFQGKEWLEEHEAQQLAESYETADPESFDAAGEEFAEEMVRVFTDLPGTDMEVERPLEHRHCPGTNSQARKFRAELDSSDFGDDAQLITAITTMNERLRANDEWPPAEHELTPDDPGRAGVFHYRWEHGSVTMPLDVDVDVDGSSPSSFEVHVESECYYVPELTEDQDFGPDELE